jgi:hypothetical protein
VTYVVPNYVAVSEFLDGGGPVAQATVDSTGRAVAFASLPYPGENAVFFPGVLSAVLGQPIPTSYPFYVHAEYPVTPESEVTDPSASYELKAKADQGWARGLAAIQFGGAGDSAVSTTSDHAQAVLDEADKTTASAESISRGLSFGEGTLTVISVRSRSVTEYTQGETKPVTATELVVEGARVQGQLVTVGTDGVHAGDQTVPIPFGEGAENLNEVLKRAGLTVRTISAEPAQGGASADMLEVTSKHVLPVPGNPEGTFVWRFGGATTAIILGADANAQQGDTATERSVALRPAPIERQFREVTGADGTGFGLPRVSSSFSSVKDSSPLSPTPGSERAAQLIATPREEGDRTMGKPTRHLSYVLYAGLGLAFALQLLRKTIRAEGERG